MGVGKNSQNYLNMFGLTVGWLELGENLEVCANRCFVFLVVFKKISKLQFGIFVGRLVLGENLEEDAKSLVPPLPSEPQTSQVRQCGNWIPF